MKHWRLGIEVCFEFFDGLDGYWKAWLQFVFPVVLEFSPEEVGLGHDINWSHDIVFFHNSWILLCSPLNQLILQNLHAWFFVILSSSGEYYTSIDRSSGADSKNDPMGNRRVMSWNVSAGKPRQSQPEHKQSRKSQTGQTPCGMQLLGVAGHGCRNALSIIIRVALGAVSMSRPPMSHYANHDYLVTCGNIVSMSFHRLERKGRGSWIWNEREGLIVLNRSRKA